MGRTIAAGIPVDEEALAAGFSSKERLDRGIYFTPAPLVDHVLGRVKAYMALHGQPLAVVDPACGAGAFLAGAREHFPDARLFGLELSAESATLARARTGAQVLERDALLGGIDALDTGGGPELWVGNPPYNGTSPLLRSPQALSRIQGMLPGLELPRGTSLRDDFILFLIHIAHRMQSRAGAVALVTPSSLLDAFVYAPVREALMRTLSLREVIQLGAGVFAGTRVKTCVTIWTPPAVTRVPVRFVARGATGAFAPSQLDEGCLFQPAARDWTLQPDSTEAAALDADWRAQGEPLDVLVPYSACGLKTRFDELLVDDDEDRLLARVEAFLASDTQSLEGFATRHDIPPGLVPKLRALRAWVKPGTVAEAGKIRRFFAYAGARHREGIPESAWAYCYLDRHLIPRGDHRMRGDFDPHACSQKLIFNLRELPLAATTIDTPGCVHMHRHARFAPLFVDGRPNLSARGLALAERLGSPWAAYVAIAHFVNSAPVQQTWAPAYGTRRVLPVPCERLDAEGTLR